MMIFKHLGYFRLLSESAQHYCVELYRSTPMPEYHQALVCGTPLPNDAFQSQLLQIGLIHMLVVSGAHLGFIRSFFNFLKIPAFFIWGFLSVYVFLTGAQAPVVRAWAQRFLKMPSRLLAVLWAGVFCLFVFGFSYSLLLSWIATLGICWPGKRAEWKQALLIYFMMIPPLLSLGTQHPLSILWNLIASAILGWGLLPISMFAPLHSGLGVLSEWAWKIFLILTEWMARLTPTWDYQFKVHKAWPWVYLLALQLIALKKEQAYLRSKL